LFELPQLPFVIAFKSFEVFLCVELLRSTIISKHQPTLGPNGTSSDLKEQTQSNILKSWQQQKV